MMIIKGKITVSINCMVIETNDPYYREIRQHYMYLVSWMCQRLKQ